MTHSAHRAEANPVTAGCPLACLATVISARAYEPLRQAGNWAFSPPPATVGEVARLYLAGRLAEIRGLGPRRTGEIGLCLTLAGLLDPAHHHTL